MFAMRQRKRCRRGITLILGHGVAAQVEFESNV